MKRVRFQADAAQLEMQPWTTPVDPLSLLPRLEHTWQPPSAPGSGGGTHSRQLATPPPVRLAGTYGLDFDAAQHAASCSSNLTNCDEGVWVTLRSCDPDVEARGQCSDATLLRERRRLDPSSTTPLCCPVYDTQPCGSKSCMCSYSQLPFANDAAFARCGGVCDYANIGDRCFVGCADSAIGAPPVGFTCLGGEWSTNDKLPPCDDRSVRECPAVFNDSTAALRMSVYSGICDGARHGDECVIHCLPGYRPRDGHFRAECREGIWSHDLNCVPQEACTSSAHEVPCDIPTSNEPPS